jgi:hypothetical protein
MFLVSEGVFVECSGLACLLELGFFILKIIFFSFRFFKIPLIRNITVTFIDKHVHLCATRKCRSNIANNTPIIDLHICPHISS